MRNKYKNELFNLIKDTGFSPNDFNLIPENQGGLPITKLKYKESPFDFIIRNAQDSYEKFQFRYVKYGPSFPLTNFAPTSSYAEFPFVYSNFGLWLNNHVMEYENDQLEPDLWSEYKDGTKTLDFNNIDFDDKSDFTINERKQVTFAINELKLLIEKNFAPSNEERILIHQRLEYLVESTTNLNKFDWKSLAFSTIIGIATTLCLDTEKGKLLFELFRQVFTTVHLLGN